MQKLPLAMQTDQAKTHRGNCLVAACCDQIAAATNHHQLWWRGSWVAPLEDKYMGDPGLKQNSYGIYGVHGLKSEMWLSRVIEPGHISAHRHCATGRPHTMLGKAWGCRSQTLVEDFLTDGGQVYPRLGFLLDAPRAIPVVLRIGGGTQRNQTNF